MKGHHHYTLTVEWTGNNGTGTSHAAAYERSHIVRIDGKADLICSSDPAFRGDNTKHNPEEFLLAAVSSCHMLWYLHLCADAGIIVNDYTDYPEGEMVEATATERGRFTEITLHPLVTITDSTRVLDAEHLHEKAREKCFISNSCNFPIHHQPTIVVKAVGE
jgi:organic hydroperoxide reductase OsmC/OhrA